VENGWVPVMVMLFLTRAGADLDAVDFSSGQSCDSCLAALFAPMTDLLDLIDLDPNDPVDMTTQKVRNALQDCGFVLYQGLRGSVDTGVLRGLQSADDCPEDYQYPETRTLFERYFNSAR